VERFATMTRARRRDAVLFTFLLVACRDESLDPLGGGGQGGAGAGASTQGGGGAGGDPDPPTRGDPATFPTTCAADCEEACNRIADCGSESSPVHPMGRDECFTRCALAADGPLWEDISGVFRCCASQPECADAAHCGGWLLHPSAIEPCEQICGCFFSATVSELTSGHEAPVGYRFAPDVVFVEPARGAPDPRGITGVRRVERGAYHVVTLGPAERPDTLAALRSAGRVLPTFTDRSGRLSAASGRIVVRAQDAAARDLATRELARFGAGSPAKPGFAEDLYVYEPADPWAALDGAHALRALGIDAELDMIRLYEKRHQPNDPLYEDQWHLENIGQGPSTRSVDVRAGEAWDITLGDPTVLVAVNDDGLDLNHPDFATKTTPPIGFPEDWEAQMQAGLFGSHGTSCAGVAGAHGDNVFAGSGVCPDCEILPHLLGPSVAGQFQISDVDIAEGFEAMVDAGAWVISNSWGPSTGNPVYEEPALPIPGLSSVVKAAFDYAETSGRMGLGTVILFAAGNSNDVLDAYGQYTTNLAVGAVNDLGLKSYYSSFGPLLDISAPSNGGLAGITTTAFNGGTTPSFGGTSSACPLVAGVVGLVFSANPGLTAAQARAIVTSTARKIDPVFGQYDANGVSPFYGHGMVDAARAVRLAAGLCADAASCRAPSDECGSACGTKTACDVCRTTADCVSGSVCQALPSLGILTCIAPVGGGCAAGTHEVAGYCVPDPSTCDLCAPIEYCNGRDDDCDGQADEDGACEEGARCFFEGPGCGEGMACAGTSCVPVCEDDADCAEGQACENLKDAYGAVTGTRACVTSSLSGCQVGCEVLVSSLEDGPLAEFVTCMEEAGSSCNQAFGCTSLLPIDM
jgi:subtilisin family serine protease